MIIEITIHRVYVPARGDISSHYEHTGRGYRLLWWAHERVRYQACHWYFLACLQLSIRLTASHIKVLSDFVHQKLFLVGYAGEIPSTHEGPLWSMLVVSKANTTFKSGEAFCKCKEIEKTGASLWSERTTEICYTCPPRNHSHYRRELQGGFLHNEPHFSTNYPIWLQQ